MKQTKSYNQKLIQSVIENGPQQLYEIFNNESVERTLSGVTLENTLFRGKRSQKALSIKHMDTGQDLACIFGLDWKIFADKYLQATSGDGQEARRIRTLHSSSLLCLLCFYGVSEERPLNLIVEGRQVRFTSSQFEVKNPVGTDETGKEHNSNMDVVLYGKDSQNGKKVILFLESKFSEYLTWGKYSGISNHVYRKIYAQLSHNGVLERMGLKYEENPDNRAYSDLASIKGNTLHYAGGVKQMLSHFLGVKNTAAGKQFEDYDIYLGEILFKFPDSFEDANIKFKDYIQLYNSLAEGLNQLSEDKFNVQSQCLTYQDVFKDYDLEESVRSFYSL